MGSPRLRAQIEAMTGPQLRAHMEALRARDRTLEEEKPRPIRKLYGARGPTPEQAEQWRRASSAWNAARRRYLAEYRICVDVSNERLYERERAASVARPPKTTLAEAATGVATHAIERDVALILLEEIAL